MDLQYVAVTVTLVAANTPYHLLDLLRAIEPNCPTAARQLCLQSDWGNGNAVVSVGDAHIGAGRRGYTLVAGDSRVYTSNLKNVRVANRYLRSDTPGALINVELETA